MTPEQRKREDNKPLDRGKVLELFKVAKLLHPIDTLDTFNRELNILVHHRIEMFENEINSGRLDVEDG